MRGLNRTHYEMARSITKMTTGLALTARGRIYENDVRSKTLVNTVERWDDPSEHLPSLQWRCYCVEQMDIIMRDPQMGLVAIWVDKGEVHKLTSFLNSLESMIIHLGFNSPGQYIPSTFNHLHTTLTHFWVYYLLETALSKDASELLVEDTSLYFKRLSQVEMLNSQILDVWPVFLLEVEAYVRYKQEQGLKEVW